MMDSQMDCVEEQQNKKKQNQRTNEWTYELKKPMPTKVKENAEDRMIHSTPTTTSHIE